MIDALLISLVGQMPGGGYTAPDWERSVHFNDPIAYAVPDLNRDSQDDWFVYDEDFTLFSGSDGSVIWNFPDKAYEDLHFVDFESDGELSLICFSRFPDASLMRLDLRTGVVEWRARARADPDAYLRHIQFFDLDGDGVKEILTSSLLGRKSSRFVVAVFDQDGNEWWSEKYYQGSYRELSLDSVDVNGDGIVEVLIGDSLHSGSLSQQGRILLVNAVNGLVLWERTGSADSERLGEKIRVVDLDGDRALEVLSVSPTATVTGMLESGRIECLDAQGSSLWSVAGVQPNQRLGESFTLGDAGFDSRLELFVGSQAFDQGSGLAQALDTADGSEIYRIQDWPHSTEFYGGRVFFQQSAQPGRQWLVVTAEDFDAQRGLSVLYGVDFRDAATGKLIRRCLYPIEGTPSKGEISVVDLDRNGEPEAYLHFPSSSEGGHCAALSPSRGVVWEEVGDSAGMQFVKIPGSGSIPARVVYSSGADRPDAERVGKVYCRRASDGRLLWQERGAIEWSWFGSKIEALPSENESAPVLQISTVHPGPYGSRLHRSDTGARIAAFPVFGFSSSRVSQAYSLDSNLDGIHEAFIVTRNQAMQYSSTSIDRGFLESKVGAVSRASGGSFNLELDFTQACAWWEYRVIVSGHGIGETSLENQIVVPLAYDRLFARTANGLDAQGWIPEARGSLNAFGEKSVRVQIRPHALPSGLVGHSLTFAAATREPWGTWRYCSVPVEVRVTP